MKPADTSTTHRLNWWNALITPSTFWDPHWAGCWDFQQTSHAMVDEATKWRRTGGFSVTTSVFAASSGREGQ